MRPLIWKPYGVIQLAERFNRDYELTIGIGDTAVTIRPPLRIVYDGTKSLSRAANRLDVHIYNLTRAKREALVKDIDIQATKYIPITLKVGYEGRLEQIYKGSVHIGSNSRQGANHVTKLECLDGGFDIRNSFTSKTVKGSENAVDAAVEDMPNTGKGKITSPENDLVRPKVMVGNSADMLAEAIGEADFFIDSEQVYILKSNEVVSLAAAKVSAGTGLLDTPERDQGIISFASMMNPTIRLAGLVDLEAETAPHLNGLYRVDTINYKGDYDGASWAQFCKGVLAQGVELI